MYKDVLFKQHERVHGNIFLEIENKNISKKSKCADVSWPSRVDPQMVKTTPVLPAKIVIRFGV